MRIIIIGAKGMLGGELVKVFSRENEVLAWDREEIDITDLKNSKFQIPNSKPDLVINSAAYNDVDRAESEPEKANLVNGTAVGNLAKICSELDIPLVHYSTDHVFGSEKREGYREDDKPDPISAYGESKLLGERELAANANKYYLIRLSRLFGAPAKSAAGKKSFVELMLDLAKNQSEIDVVDEELSSPTHAPDLAEMTRLLVEKKKPYGIYHITNSGSCTWYEFAKEVFNVKDLEVKLNPVKASHFPRPAKRPKFSVLINTKLPPMRQWQDALTEFLKG